MALIDRLIVIVLLGDGFVLEEWVVFGEIENLREFLMVG